MTESTALVIPDGRRRVRDNVREVLVVALGILIAFSVDAWWDGAQERDEFERLLNAVEAELQLNIEALARTTPDHGRVAAAGFAILNLTGPSSDVESANSASELLSDFWPNPETSLSATAVSSALASGTLGSLRDEELGAQLARLPGAYARLEGYEGNISRLMAENVFPQLWRYVPQINLELAGGFGGDGALFEELAASLPTQSRFEPDFAGLLGDLAFENVVLERVTWAMMARDNSGALQIRLEEILSRLQQRVR